MPKALENEHNSGLILTFASPGGWDGSANVEIVKSTRINDPSPDISQRPVMCERPGRREALAD
jgi:hypothetical protein